MVAQVVKPAAGNLRFLKASEAARSNGLVALLYGPPGSGKTTLAASAQDSEHGRDVLLIDADGGVKSIEDRDDITVLRLEKYAQLMQVANALRSGQVEFKTVVVDTISEAQALDMREITAGKGGIPEQRDWGVSTNHLAEVLRSYRDLAYSKGVNVVFTAHVKEDKDAAGNVTGIRPGMTPAAMNIATGAVDVLGYLTFHPKTGKRVLNLGGSALFWAKRRQGKSVAALPDKIEDPSMVEILRLLRAGAASPAEGR